MIVIKLKNGHKVKVYVPSLYDEYTMFKEKSTEFASKEVRAITVYTGMESSKTIPCEDIASIEYN